ncbi:MAG TPA: hypothetical protein VJ871_02110 [Bacteroidales bacterium]|nr:hypothetical protein [Bacteroidales bacterium]
MYRGLALLVYCLFLPMVQAAESIPITYEEIQAQLNPWTFYVDGRLSDEEASAHAYVFNDLKTALQQVQHGNKLRPMRVFIAPYVYWLDDPEDPKQRRPKNGTTPYALEVACEYLHLYGMAHDPSHVVLACNRGQTLGAEGNFTLLHLTGNGIRTDNLTFGNYCNVDLVYPPDTSLNRTKRSSTIVQAQLIHCKGDRVVANNCRFISRLNTCPFVGATRALFNRCHIECTDDALCGTGIYHQCSFVFFSSKPFYRTEGTGAVFLDCEILSHTSGQQYFTKAGGPVALIDTRFTGPEHSTLAWRDEVPSYERNYQMNVRWNNKNIKIDARHPEQGIDLSAISARFAYQYEWKGKKQYNLYNLTGSVDGWDPMNLKHQTEQAAIALKRPLTQLPVQLRCIPERIQLETGRDSCWLELSALGYGGKRIPPKDPVWILQHKDSASLQLLPSVDGSRCLLVPTHTEDDTKQIKLCIIDAYGLEAACLIEVRAGTLPAPDFLQEPTLQYNAPLQRIELKYQLNSRRKDFSDIRWHRVSPTQDNLRLEQRVSSPGSPCLIYPLSPFDHGYCIEAEIKPADSRSQAGAGRRLRSAPIAYPLLPNDSLEYKTTFSQQSARNQKLVLSGSWRLDHWEHPSDLDAWFYGAGQDGAKGQTGLMPRGRSAILGFEPGFDQCGDSRLRLHVYPFKTAGQGFSRAGMYMDLLIKWDEATQSGYGLRLIRTTAQSDAIEGVLMAYKGGEMQPLCAPEVLKSFRPDCSITLSITGNLLMAEVREASNQYQTFHMETSVEPRSAGGFLLRYMGGAPLLIRSWTMNWYDINDSTRTEH